MRSRRKQGIVLAAACAAGLTVLQCCGSLRPLATKLFGPPEVELREAYAGDVGDLVFDHSSFDALLRRFVDARGFVDYEGLSGERGPLDRYLDELAAAPFERLSRDGKLALSLNAYNAFTLALVLEHYPLDGIKDIPSAERWEARRWRLAGRTLSLDQLEHEELRPKFAEPRIHFALVCAAASCPPLRAEAYVGEHLEEQLADQARRVHSDPRWFALDAERREVRLTSLYDWFGTDFAQVAGSVLEYAAQYSDALSALLASGESVRVSWIDYDWSLNDQAR